MRIKKLCLLLLLLIFVFLPIIGFANAASDTEFEQFLDEHGIEVHKIFEDNQSAEAFYGWVMDILREDPSHAFAFGHYDYQIFSEQIQQAYLQEIATTPSIQSNPFVDQRGMLQDSTYYDAGATTYHCYSYATN